VSSVLVVVAILNSFASAPSAGPPDKIKNTAIIVSEVTKTFRFILISFSLR
jgi:hypothetical protein